MSMTKRREAYARHMDEHFMQHREEIEEAERIALLEREEQHNLADKYPNVHDKAGTKEDVFGILGRIFKP